MASTTEQNKKIVAQFNKECIQEGNLQSFNTLLAKDCINHAAQPGSSNGPESMIHFLNNILRPAFSDLKVTILDQIAEGDKVTTRKEIQGTHTGVFMGVNPTNKKVVIKVIDIIRLRDGQYVEHWGMSNISDVVVSLQ